jgi:hypothetical protein
MWFVMRPVDLGLLETAEQRYVTTRDVAASRMDAWATIADPTTWPAWWPGVTAAGYEPPQGPFGVGTRRRATVGGQRFEETMLAWDTGVRFAYRIDRATLPLAHAQVECTELEDRPGGGTRVRWRLAVEPRLMMRAAAPFFPRVIDRLFARAMAGLDAYVVTRASGR